MRKIFILASLFVCQHLHSQNSISIGANGSTGNFRSIGVIARADIKDDSCKFTWSINPVYRWSKISKYGSTALKLYENELYVSASIAKRYKKIRVIGFTENERSYQRNINLRSSIGMGLGVIVIKNKELEVLLSEAVLPEYYFSTVNTFNNNFTLRASTRLKIEVTHKTFKLSSVTLFQPALFSNVNVSGSDNLNYRSVNTVSVGVNKTLEIGVTALTSYQAYSYYINKAVSPSQTTASVIVKIKI